MTYELWNRKDDINGVSASHFLDQPPFKNYNGDIILIYGDNGKVTNVECKDILANVYGIDPALELDEFMAEYFEKLEPADEDEPSDDEPAE